MAGQVRVRKGSRKAVNGFQYSQLAGSIQRSVQEEVQNIRRLLAKSAASAVQIGLRLQFVRNTIGRRHFQAWLKAEFSWSQSVASTYMCIARAFGHRDHLDGIQASALYVLARRKVPVAAREEALRRAAAGEFITKARAQVIVARHLVATPSRHAVRTEKIRQQVEQSLRTDPARVAADDLREVGIGKILVDFSRIVVWVDWPIGM